MSNNPARRPHSIDSIADVLVISPEKLAFIIAKAKEFDVKDAVADERPASNPIDDAELDVLELHAGAAPDQRRRLRMVAQLMRHEQR